MNGSRKNEGRERETCEGEESEKETVAKGGNLIQQGKFGRRREKLIRMEEEEEVIKEKREDQGEENDKKTKEK